MNYRRLLLPALLLASIIALVVFTGGPATAGDDACDQCMENIAEIRDECIAFFEDQGEGEGSPWIRECHIIFRDGANECYDAFCRVFDPQ